jgi:hypothetical protein
MLLDRKSILVSAKFDDFCNFITPGCHVLPVAMNLASARETR